MNVSSGWEIKKKKKSNKNWFQKGPGIHCFLDSKGYVSSPPHKLPSYKEDDPKIAGENSSCCTGAQTSFNKNKEFPDFIEFEVSEVGISLDYEQMPTLFFFFQKETTFLWNESHPDKEDKTDPTWESFRALETQYLSQENLH